MKDYIITRCLSMLALFVSISTYAYDFESGGIYYEINGNNVSVEKGDIEYKGDITIPEKVKFNDKTYTVHRQKRVLPVLRPDSDIFWDRESVYH